VSDNVYKKLQKCRVELKQVEIKESGNNKFAGYTYMELGDFLPHIVDLCDKYSLCTIVSFGGIASLTVVNSDDPQEQIVFTSPMSTADLKGCHAIQNLGAVETYLRRYLYVAAFDIVEHDALDSTQGKKDEKEQKKTQQVSTRSAPPAPTANEADAAYHERVKTALKAIYGDDKAAALAKVEELTSFVPKGKTEAERVKGIRDFTKLSGKRLEILCHSIEKMVKSPATCKACDGILDSGKCWNVNCGDFAG
jgi:hypothetical protein